ncbi:NAD(P)-binding domain-containing protein [Actibacterium sp. MT2.3-13A]|uniref:shikimate dehydrogenase family protein n=1 Tax=Actibacterium sp. MT2.3-13A TaxID=2828332 RepID=UPI001BAA7F67|nr:NAD(P)-binding domain-containing protein [Actibacterium sp. MT2.3-13A]
MAAPGALRAGLIGAHIGRTRLPAALRMMCEESGLDFAFELIDTADRPEFDFEETVAACRAAGWKGVSVTHPHKAQAADWVDGAMAAGLRGLGACNTITFGPPLRGFNTDYTGFLSAWRAERGAALPGRVAMAGAGGVARALGPALARLGAREIAIWDARPERAEELAQRIGPAARAVPIAQAAEIAAASDGLVNATPLGMAEYPGSAFPTPLSGAPQWAFDAVYTPTRTAFVQAAEAAGAQVITGFALFKHMALRTFEAYTGLPPDAARILPRLDYLIPDKELTT